MTASGRIAEYVTSVDAARTPDATVREVARAFLDTYAVAVAARDEPIAAIVGSFAEDRPGPARHWGIPGRSHAETAALVNGVLAHVLDYDDVTSPLRGHPSVAMLPALIALGETTGATGRDVSAAYAVGFEVVCKIARAVVADHYGRGWHSTTTIGLLGATTASAHLLRLGPNQVQHALGLAIAQAAGTRQNFGTMAKSFQVGACGAAAVRAATLAQAGMTGSSRALDGALGGFTALYCGDGGAEALAEQLATLGDGAGELHSSGLDVKKYPLCYATHRVVETLFDMRSDEALTLDDVAAVEITTNRGGLVPLVHHRPATGLEAKFSMEYAVAAALHDGRLGLATFTDRAVQRPQLQAFLPRVHAREGQGPMFPRWAEVTVHRTNGDPLVQRRTALRGSAEAPLTDDQLLDKVADCLGHPPASEAVQRLAATVLGWADEPIDHVSAQLETV